jgi:hypothetical protein
MRTLLLSLALCVTCLAKPLRDVEVVVSPSAAHPQDWLHLQLRENPKPNYQGKPVSSLAEFVAPEVISKIVSRVSPQRHRDHRIRVRPL